ncbi:MAG: aminotransferase class I/II-fold pyridoxal phosphate-dependent enzyme [Candidatus Jordarchaeaceae archaeon]
MRVKIADRIREFSYAIRDIVVHAERLEAEGKKITYLNIGDPSLYFDTPDHLKEALAEAVNSGCNFYAPSEGLPELREAICYKERMVNGVRGLEANDIIVTAGVSEGIQMLLGAIANPGDEILIPGPTYPPYISFSKFFGANPIMVRCIEEDGWQPDLDDVRKKITDKTKALLLVNPNNPCGSVYDQKVLKELISIAGEYDILLASDEIYDRIVYDKKFTSTASIAKDVPVIGFNGFSKTYLVTGWRVGYMYFYDPDEELNELRENIEKEARARICANTPVQKACLAAIYGPQDHIQEMVSKLKERRNFTYKRLNEISGLSCTKPEGAFYAFPKIETMKWKDDSDFVLKVLTETQLLLVNGSGFDPIHGKNHFRIVFLPDLEVLEEAFDKLENFFKKV